jgi:general secretion pathway protein C
VGVLGFGGGALANQVTARLLALPDDAELPEYADAPVADAQQPATADDSQTDTSHPPTRPPRVLSEKQLTEIILKRNIFDSTAAPEVAGPVSGNGECKSDGNVKLLATIVADLPTYSSALIAIGGGRDSKADGYAVGDDVSGEGKIALIEQKRVCLDGGVCYCMGTDNAKPGAPEAKADKGGGEGVEQLADNKFAVDSSLIEDAMNNLDTLATQVRAVPHKGADGAVDGFRLSAIRHGSVLDKLGIKNGDIVHGVNGNPLTSTESAMQVYQTLRNEKSFSFDVTRRNQRQSLEYEVR